MKLLAFETATEACSVALWIDGEVRERYEVAPRRHGELVLPWADALLDEAGLAKTQLDAIAVGRGPGAFTGVRLAIAIAQGIALALDLPIVPVSTLAALALPCEGDALIAAIDARMGEVYVGAYVRDAEGLVEAFGPERLAPPNAVELPDARRWAGIGTGFAAEGGALLRSMRGELIRVDPTALPRAADIARLAQRAFERGEAVAPERVEPAYLRDKVALTLVEQQASRAAK